MSMFGSRCGTWWLSSESDSRWNRSGKADVGGFAMGLDARKVLEELKSLYGEPPDDLEHGYMKD
jgi:hypothetical protein